MNGRDITRKFALAGSLALLTAFAATGAELSLQNVPLYISSQADPNILLNMSVETPMGGAAYTDNVGVPNSSCTGRLYNVLGDNSADDIGWCYQPAITYLGYFDAEKCYEYSSDRFEPRSATNTDHTCSGRWSGNFLNWASMTAIDMFIMSMTGGDRVVDTTSETVVKRARKQDNNSWFPRKVLNATINVAPSTVTPYTDATLFIHNRASSTGVPQFQLGTSFGTATATPTYGPFNVYVKVCHVATGVEKEANCQPYMSGSTTYYKPEGLIQRNASSKRFAAISYSLDGANRNGGVMRSQMKYVGPTLPDGSTNPNREFGTDGRLISDPDNAGGGLNSGVINYINKFSDYGYKSSDPVSELFYESIRFFKNIGRTPEYADGLTDAQKGGFQVLTSWQDPMQYRCQKNFVVAINDANPWYDKKLPGTSFTSSTITMADGSSLVLGGADYGEPSNPDTDINVTTLTNRVGELEGLHAVWANNGTWTSGTVSGTNDSVGGGNTTFDNSCNTSKTVAQLGQVMGTCPYPPKQNSYYVAGLAYYANTNDLRDDLDDDRGIQNVQSFFIDTQEFNAQPLDGNKNMLWLAGKYGGFVDTNGDAIPQTSEWDSDSDGIPDNYVFATQPQNLIDGLDNAFAFIDRQITSASAASVNAGSISEGTRVYQARFNSGDWTGELLTYRIDEETGELEETTPDFASELNSTLPSSRQIITRNSNGSAVAFTTTALDETRKDQLDNSTDNTRANNLIAYLRGDSANEVDSSGNGEFRARTSKLGDIISSSPLYVGPPRFGYRDSLQAGDPYSTFAYTWRNRTGIIYVGANDGMLHAFDASSGDEVFAYIPGAVFGRLSNLASPTYTHEYFVDGSPSMADVFFTDADKWRTVLVGGLNKGGQAIYALDITSPSTLSNAETNASSVALWEFTDTDNASVAGIQGHPDLGYTFSQPAIGKMKNGRWAAIFGNGYNSTSTDDGDTSTGTGKASLFIVDIETGTLMTSAPISTEVGDTSSPNGLATPALVDIDGDRVVDYAYAGDLQGNMWKFDLTSTSPSNWKIAHTRTVSSVTVPAPLFAAVDESGNAQPITVRPEVARGPGGEGMMILFGTGKYLETIDKQLTPERPQTFYGIFDRNTLPTSSNPSAANDDIVSSRDDLTEQQITHELLVDFDPDGDGPETQTAVRVTTNFELGSNSGWYIDLVSPENDYEAEKQVSNPIVRNGNVIFTTLIPTTDPCDFGGSSWIMELDVLSGARKATSPFDLNRDGQFATSDYVTIIVDGEEVLVPASGVGSLEGILQSPGVLDGQRTVDDVPRPVQYKYLPGTTGEVQQVIENPGAGGVGRQSWRQVR
jgi:type IV pilus assembly protein PilY1